MKQTWMIFCLLMAGMLLLCGGSYAGQSKTLSLAAAKKTALENSPTLAAAKERVTQALEQLKQARSERMPSLDFSGSLDHTTVSGNSATSGYTGTLSATWVLFNGFKTKYSELAAAYGEKVRQEAHKEAQNLLIWSVASAYHNVQLARENITIALSDKTYNEKLAEEARVKERIGTGSLSDLLNFQTQVNSAKSSLITAENEYRTALYGLAQLMGRSNFPENTRLAELSPELDTDVVDVEYEIASALRNRPEIRESGHGIRQAQANIGVAKSGFYPEISLYGSLAGTGNDDNGLNHDDLEQSVGIKVTMNLFSGGKTRSGVAEARSLKREAENNYTESVLLLTSNVRSAADSLLSAGGQLSLQRENTALVEKTRNLVEKEYRAGQVSLVRMNEAQNDLVSARSSLAKARAELMLARETLNYYTGNVREEPEPKNL